MRFSSWYTAEDIVDQAPPEPGVFQVRGPGLFQYPRGRSAMVHYGCAEDLRQAMTQWATAHGQRGWRYRHAADLGARTPRQALEILLERFRDRFGTEPKAG